MKILIRTLQAAADIIEAYKESKQALAATKKRMSEVSESIQMYKAILAMPPRIDAKTYLQTK